MILTKYRQLKDRYSDRILFFRIGDFFETFEDSAKFVGAELNIVVTTRELEKGQKVAMAGFPYFVAEKYFQKLTGAGYKLAIVEASDQWTTYKAEKLL